MKVYNYSTCCLEVAKKETCPRCKGFGSLCNDLDKGVVCLCKGRGVVWISENSWVRAIGDKREMSQLW